MKKLLNYDKHSFTFRKLTEGLVVNTPRAKLLFALLYSGKPLLELCVDLITGVASFSAYYNPFRVWLLWQS